VQPDVLLLDEVLAVGDLAFQQKCFARIAELKHGGITMIFISHNLEAVQQLCDRALLLREGQVAAQGTPEAMVQRYRQEVVTRALAEPMTQPLPDRGGEVRIRHVQLQDADGREVGVWETGRPLRIEIGYEALRPIRHAEFRVSLERLDGLLCHATSSRAAGLVPPELSGRGAITLAYPALNLLPNCYQVAVEVFEAQNPIPLASVRHQRFFQVTSDDHEQGAVHLEHRWEVA
jgi:ABC-type glutathione transport system ATPase component